MFAYTPLAQIGQARCPCTDSTKQKHLVGGTSGMIAYSEEACISVRAIPLCAQVLVKVLDIT